MKNIHEDILPAADTHRNRYYMMLWGFLAALIFPAVPLRAASWNLEQCLRYARENNIRIKSARLDSLSAEADRREALAALFPGLSANTRYNASQGDDDFGTVMTGGGTVGRTLSYSLNTDLTLFDGLRTGTDISRQRRKVEKSAYSAAQAAQDVSSAVIQAYLQALYAQELLGIAEQAHETSAGLLARTRERRAAGSVSDIAVAQAASDHASDAYNLVTARNSRDLSVLALRHLLELPADEPFVPAFDECGGVPPQDSGTLKTDILTRARGNSPAVRRDSLGVVIAQLDLKTARAGYWPTLSLTGSLSGSNSMDGAAAGYAADAYGAALGLQLSLPLYDNRKTGTAVEKCRIAVDQARLGLTATEKGLTEDIETALGNAAASRSRLQAADAKRSAATAGYDLARQQYELGMLDPLDLQIAKNSYIAAGTEQLQARYAVYLNTMLLDLYQGRPVSFANFN